MSVRTFDKLVVLGTIEVSVIRLAECDILKDGASCVESVKEVVYARRANQE
jgi:hypothetical protein